MSEGTDERGSAVIEFVLVMGLAVFPIMGLLSIVTWPERINASAAASYEAAKAVVEAPDPAAAMGMARARALEVIANHGYDTTDVVVTFEPADPRRGDNLTATVRVTLPAVNFPGLGSWDAMEWSKSSTLVVGPYRGFQ